MQLGKEMEDMPQNRQLGLQTHFKSPSKLILKLLQLSLFAILSNKEKIISCKSFPHDMGSGEILRFLSKEGQAQSEKMTFNIVPNTAHAWLSH